MSKKYTVKDIQRIVKLPLKVAGNPENKFFTNLSTPDRAKKDSLIFVSDSIVNAKALITNTLAEIIICDNSIELSENVLSRKCFILTDNPKLVFLRVGNEFFKNSMKAGIHKTATVHPEAKISKSCYIGPNCYVGKVVIGDNTALYGNNYIYDNTLIGSDVIIQAGAVIGADGLGHILNEEGIYENFPHVCGVVIEDNVEIGVNTCVSKGALKDTIIRKNSKIDCHVQIGHNAEIEENVLIAANSVIGGSSLVGRNTWIGISVTVSDYVKVGKDCFISAGSIILKDVPDSSRILPKISAALPNDFFKGNK